MPIADTITPFEPHVPDNELDDLYARLTTVRWPDPETVEDTGQGPQSNRIKALVERWQRDYDWRACEKMINDLGSYRTEIDGLGIHFLHIRSPEPDALPVVITHGWPGSVREFRDTISPLTDPVAHSGNAEDAFHLVLPTLPGFGWSDKPTEPDWNIGRIAGAWVELMQRLGYERWVAQGGDFGASATTALGYMQPESLAGVHLNMGMF